MLWCAGNILLRGDGSIALLDFGQAKQLSRQLRLDLARLMVALSAAEDADLLHVTHKLTRPQQQAVADALQRLGVETAEGPLDLKVRLAYGMLDSRGRVSFSELRLAALDIAINLITGFTWISTPVPTA